MKPALKYWIFLLGIAGIIFGVIFASVAGSWFSLTGDEQRLIAGMAIRILPFPVMGALVLVGIIGTLVSLLFRFYIIPILRMAESTQLISLANPNHRIQPAGSREVVHLAEIINDSAEAYLKLRTEVDAAIRNAQADLKEERNRFAALMSELPVGVLVCNTDGQILLYNQLAQTLLHAPPQDPGDPATGGLVGLGRSLFGVLQREPVVHGLKLLQQAVTAGQAIPTTGFMTTLADGRCLRVTMAPAFSFHCEEHEECRQCEQRQMTGLVLTIEDMTPQIEVDTRRDQLIQSLTADVQIPLDEIRRAIGAILTQPDMAGELLQRYRSVIDDAARSLQRQLMQARVNVARHLRGLRTTEEVLAENLLQVLRRTIEERGELRVDCRAEEGLWLRLDSASMVQAISHLAGLLGREGSLRRLRISIERSDEETATLTLAWPGTPLAGTQIATWLESPLTTDSQGRILSFRDLLAGCGGAITTEIAPPEEFEGIRIELPSTPSAVRAELAPPQGPRPVYYEFNLFNQQGLQELGSQPLRNLTYVVFDTETTGLNPAQGDEIIQIGAVRIVNGRILQDEIMDQLIDPKRAIPEVSVAIHGITRQMVDGQPTIEQVLPLFHRFVEGAVLVAHNASFDMRCLQLKERQTGVRFDNPVLDTLLLSSILHPHQEAHSVDEIARRLNLTIVGRHTALGDALVTAEVFLKLIPLLAARGIVTLQDALQASRASRYAKLTY